MTWEETRAFRLARQHLSDPLGPRSLRRVVKDLGGVHAQVASAGELQCALRAPGLAAGAVDNALWKQRSLVKTWMMRGTLHYVDADDLPVWAAASVTRDSWKKPAWQKYTGLSVTEVEGAVEAIAEALDGNRLTREAIADAVHRKKKNAALDEHLRSGWGSILKIAASYGLLCYGTSQGRNVTFVRPDQWVASWSEVDADDAIEEVCRRYLASHGPATREEFARWWGFMPPDASKVLERLGDEVTRVDRAGDKAFVLARDLKNLERAEEDEEIRLLGMFDAYTLAGLPHEAVVPKKHKNEVYRTGAWVSQVVLRGGRVVGVWTHDRKAKGTTVEVKLFEKRAATKARLEELLRPFEPWMGTVSSLKLV